MEAILGNWGSTSHIGGYPNWLLRDDIPDLEGKNLVFQLESGLCNEYVWCNDGIIYIHSCNKSNEYDLTIQDL